jgi:hypothetical protein
VLVNNAMKALPKKRRNQTTRDLSVNMSKTSMHKYQALWYSTFIAMYIWFLYWVCNDFFVWHKPIAEINAVNYIGAIVSIAFIWAGTRILKRNSVKTRSQSLMPQMQPQQEPPQTTPQPTASFATPTTPPVNSTCNHYLGYLNQRQKQQEIPSECLTCEHVVKCMSSAN